MGIFWATRDLSCDDFHIETARLKKNHNIGLNQVWELNGNPLEAEVWVEGETLEEGALKALRLFKGEEEKEQHKENLYITSFSNNGNITTKKYTGMPVGSIKTDTPLSHFNTREIYIYHYAENETEAHDKALLTIFHELRDIVVRNQNNS